MVEKSGSSRPSDCTKSKGASNMAKALKRTPIMATNATKMRSSQRYRLMTIRIAAAIAQSKTTIAESIPSAVLSPIPAPDKLPDWYAALPTPTAKIISNSKGVPHQRPAPKPLMRDAKSRSVVKALRTASSCSSTVANTEKTIAQMRVMPVVAPATLAVVMVPGPINAAATIAPGPIRNPINNL